MRSRNVGAYYVHKHDIRVWHMALEYGIGRKGQKWVSPDRLSYQTTPISIKQILCSNFCVQTLDVDSFFTEWQYLHCSVSFPFTLSKTDWAMWKASQYSSALTGWKLIFWVLTLDQYLVTNSLIFSHHYCLRYSLCQAFALHAYPLRAWWIEEPATLASRQKLYI